MNSKVHPTPYIHSSYLSTPISPLHPPTITSKSNQMNLKYSMMHPAPTVAPAIPLHLSSDDPTCITKDTTTIEDILFGSIECSKIETMIIQAPEFQRLKKIKQLGVAFWVFTRALHTRFEHNIGTMHLASRYLDCIDSHIRNSKWTQMEVLFTSRDRDCVRLAALCHDLGHAFMPHIIDSFFDAFDEEKARVSTSHETFSGLILERIIQSSPQLQKMMNDTGFTFTRTHPDDYTDLDFVKELIWGSSEEASFDWKWRGGHNPRRKYLFEIVANKYSDLDVDKLDYLLRDCHYTGFHQESLKLEDIQNIFHLVQIVSDGSDGWHLAFLPSAEKSLKSVFETRFLMHRDVYLHPKSKSLQELAIDALQENKLVELSQGIRLQDAKEDLDAYLLLDDELPTRLLRSQNLDYQGEYQPLTSRQRERLIHLIDGQAFKIVQVTDDPDDALPVQSTEEHLRRTSRASSSNLESARLLFLSNGAVVENQLMDLVGTAVMTRTFVLDRRYDVRLSEETYSHSSENGGRVDCHERYV